jgi:hypothetical protein
VLGTASLMTEIIPMARDLPEKLVVAQLLKIFTVYKRTLSFVAVFT